MKGIAVLTQALVWATCAPLAHAAVPCAPTTNAAVLQALSGLSTSSRGEDGYRVRDVVVDPLLHRAFVHVEQCGHPERPMVLLPFAASAASATAVEPVEAEQSLRSSQAIPPIVAVGREVAVAMGDAHMHVTVRGRILQSATVGSEVEVQLASLKGGAALPGEEAKRVRGRLIAADRVEVQP